MSDTTQCRKCGEEFALPVDDGDLSRQCPHCGVPIYRAWAAVLYKGDYAVFDPDGDVRATFLVRHDATAYAKLRESERATEEAGDMGQSDGLGAPDETDAAAYAPTAAASRLAHLIALQRVEDGDADQVDEQTMLGLDLGAEYDDHELTTEPDVGAAEEAMDALVLAVDRAVEFHIVLGTGGPDDRLVVEADCDGEGRPDFIRRIVYRYSWNGSRDVPLHGADLEAAERLARRLVPELA